LLFLAFAQCVLSQIVPAQNSDSKLKALSVKSISTYYNSDETGETYLVFSKEFDASGALSSMMQLALWDVVSYKHTYTYTYDDLGRLQQELIIQEILELFDRDKEFIKTFGDTPLNKKILYQYNDDNLLIKQMVLTFAEEEPPQNIPPDQTINYEYEDGVLSAEESVSSDEKFFNKNYLIKYKYDSIGNLIQKIRTYGPQEELQRTTLFQYNDQKLLIEEQTIDPSIPHNNLHLKYEYNDDGNIKNKYVFEDEEMEFELETTYTYDEFGNTISGDREVLYEYNDNGLITSETWTDPISDKLIQFKSSYTFY